MKEDELQNLKKNVRKDERRKVIEGIKEALVKADGLGRKGTEIVLQILEEFE